MVEDYESARDLIAALYPDVNPEPLFAAALITAEALLGQATAWARRRSAGGGPAGPSGVLESEILEVVRPTGVLKRV